MGCGKCGTKTGVKKKTTAKKTKTKKPAKKK